MDERGNDFSTINRSETLMDLMENSKEMRLRALSYDVISRRCSSPDDRNSLINPIHLDGNPTCDRMKL